MHFALIKPLTLRSSPAWVMPWLNGISVPCMASMHASHSVRKTLSRIFGGALPNQGLGFLSISLDTQYVSFGQFCEYSLATTRSKSKRQSRRVDAFFRPSLTVLQLVIH